MTRRKHTRLSPLHSFTFQAAKYDILKTQWDLLWRMCGKLPVEPTEEDDESFRFEGRRYVKKDHRKPPSGVLDLTIDDEEED